MHASAARYLGIFLNSSASEYLPILFEAGGVDLEMDETSFAGTTLAFALDEQREA